MQPTHTNIKPPFPYIIISFSIITIIVPARNTHFTSMKEAEESNKAKSGSRIPAFSVKTNKTQIMDDSIKLSPTCRSPKLPPTKDVVNDVSCGRERLKRHREEVAGRVSIPENWGKEEMLKDWTDYASFDALLAPNGIVSAREALVAEGSRATSQRLRIESRC